MATVLKILFLCFLVLTSTSCYKLYRFRGPCSIWPMEDPPASGPILPRTFTSAEGRFRIGLPPKEGKAAGNRIEFEWFILNQGRFVVSYSDAAFVLDTPEQSQTILDRYRDGVMKNRPAMLEVDSPISLAGHPGRELRIKNEHGVEIDRIYLAGNRIYVVSLWVHESLSCKLESAIKVLDTFEILNE